MRFEANNGGGEYADDVDRQLREQRYTSILQPKSTNSISKFGRIVQFAPDIKGFIFSRTEKDENGKPYRSKEYQDFMNELTMFSQAGKTHTMMPQTV